MTVCGHQFHGGDGSDWVLSTSVGFLDESKTASRILQELFKKRCRNGPTETPTKCPKTVIASSTKRTAPVKKKDEPEETLIVRKIPAITAFENFDESQHLNGCPIKWLYNKRLLEKKKTFKLQRLCTNQPPQKEDLKREKGNNLRDRTPVEIKIHKINLTEKYTTNADQIYTKKPEHPKGLEAHRKQLAAKLNWKLHDDTQEEPPCESVSETGSRHNYFPPRPLLGLTPLLSVLLAPQKTNCCCLVTQLRGTTPGRKGRGASLSIQSLDLPLPQPEPEPRPLFRATKALRGGSKSSANAKKLQIPTQIIMKLEQKKQNLPSEKQSNVKVIHYNPLVKKMSGQQKQTKSLSSLCYELRGKTSSRPGQNEQVFEEIIRDLTMGSRFKMQRFFKLNVESPESGRGCKNNPGKKGKSVEEFGSAKESNLVCGKITFSKNPTQRQ